jgi:hypothetical protein
VVAELADEGPDHVVDLGQGLLRHLRDLHHVQLRADVA